MRTLEFRSIAAILSLSFNALTAVAGPLNPPPGPVGPTYKPLTEVEPRIAINATNTPGVGQAKFTITQPGSYYLIGNVEVFNISHGIRIDLVSDGIVAIDLNGFSVIGHEGTLNGIDVDGPFVPRVIIRNGYITTFDGNGIDMTGTENATIEHVESTRNFGKGFVLSSGTLSHCKAQFNSLGGFDVGAHSALDHCSAIATGPIGIKTGDNCRLNECTVRGSSDNGIETESSCVLTSCVSTSNIGYGIHTYLACTHTGCTAASNGEGGFSGNQAAIYISCTARDNTKWGFSVGGSSLFQSCNSRGNGFAGFSGSASQYSECVAIDNTLDGFALGGLCNISKCTAISNNGNGISGGGACTVVECLSLYNDLHGIWLSLEGNIIRGNNCIGNGQGAAPGAGIFTQSISNRIEDNLCKDNDIGIDVDAVRSVIIRNTCAANGTNWNIAAGNTYGPIINRATGGGAAVNGDSAPAALGTTDPSANFTN